MAGAGNFQEMAGAGIYDLAKWQEMRAEQQRAEKMAAMSRDQRRFYLWSHLVNEYAKERTGRTYYQLDRLANYEEKARQDLEAVEQMAEITLQEAERAGAEI